MTSTVIPARRNVALAAARVLAGPFGAITVAGFAMFTFVVPEEAVWRGPLVDVPVVGAMLAAALLKLAVALAPAMNAARRVRLGLRAAGLGAAVTLIKIPVYDEPEGVLFLGVELLLVALLLRARQAAPRS